MRLGALARSTVLAAAAIIAGDVLRVEAAPKTATPKTSAAAAAKHAAARQTYEAYEKEAAVYWQSVVDKRRARNAKRASGEAIQLDDYVLTQPPLYKGPRVRRPRLPAVPGIPRIPVLADVLRAAEQQHGFVPQRPPNDLAFKHAYAKAALASGITADQAVGIYVFETGGNGSYDVQAGLTHPSRKARAISPAVGYNQLLITNTIGLMAEYGDRFLEVLRDKAKAHPSESKAAHERKIAATQRMIVFARSVPRRWVEHDKLAKTTLAGMAIHAAILDIDLGPLLQTQKLADSIAFARSKGHLPPLTAAELEMMNFTGDGNGFDLVTMPAAMRPLVPTSNFFQRGGYERNPIARRTGVVSALYASIEGKMQRSGQQPGARELAEAFLAASEGILTERGPAQSAAQ